jgi:hypothetical protein
MLFIFIVNLIRDINVNTIFYVQPNLRLVNYSRCEICIHFRMEEVL